MNLSKPYVIILLCIIIGFFVSAGYDNYLKNRPEITPPDVIVSELKRLLEQDSLVKVIPVKYEHTKSEFEESDTTYWHYKAYQRLNDDTMVTITDCIALPHNFFHFEKVVKSFKTNDTKIWQIHSFQQIPEASYITYKNSLKL